ncbi:MAG: hypothetical protein V7K32_14675 [Nostoc sp.]|uniref:hypothetical protein n=1 Tax=Nostoc sp. TaxID=1180 RepID=UPI002FF6AAAB
MADDFKKKAKIMNSRATSFANGFRPAFIKDSQNHPIESIEKIEAKSIHRY